MQKVIVVVVDAVDLLGTRCLAVSSDISSALILAALIHLAPNIPSTL